MLSGDAAAAISRLVSVLRQRQTWRGNRVNHNVSKILSTLTVHVVTVPVAALPTETASNCSQV